MKINRFAKMLKIKSIPHNEIIENIINQYKLSSDILRRTKIALGEISSYKDIFSSPLKVNIH